MIVDELHPIHWPHPPCVDEVHLLDWGSPPRDILLVTISAHGTTWVGGTFSGDAPCRLDACGSLGELLLTLQLEAVWVASAVRIHNAADTVANWWFSTFRVVPIWTPPIWTPWLSSVGPDITDFASSTVLIWWTCVVAVSLSCNGIKIKKIIMCEKHTSIDMFKKDLTNWEEKSWSYLQQRGWQQQQRRRGRPWSWSSWSRCIE